MGLKNKLPLTNKALFKFRFVLDCIVHQQAAVRLIVSCNSGVYLSTVFMDSTFTVQLMHNVVLDISKINDFIS